MTTIQPQPENEVWVIDFEKLSPLVDINSSVSEEVIPENKIKWFQVVMPHSGDTPLEKQEFHQAQMEQLRLGILQPRPPQTEPQFPAIFPQQKKQPLGIDLSDMFSGKPKKKPGPNEPCHCGSGKKYKKCHGPREL